MGTARTPADRDHDLRIGSVLPGGERRARFVARMRQRRTVAPSLGSSQCVGSRAFEIFNSIAADSRFHWVVVSFKTCPQRRGLSVCAAQWRKPKRKTSLGKSSDPIQLRQGA